MIFSGILRFGATVVIVMFWSLGGVAEVFEVQPSEEAFVMIDEDGSPVDFYSVVGVGDGTDGRFMRGLVAFDLSFLPPGAEVSSAVIHARVDAVYGNPSDLGTLGAARIVGTTGSPSVDIQSRWGTFSPQSPPVEMAGEIIPGSDLTADLTEQFQGFYPTSDYNSDPGRAVIRFQFATDTNGDGTGDFLYASRIRLELDVEMPSPITERPIGRHLKRCIPVVASLPGAESTQWVTELHITARHDGSVWLYFTETGEDGTANFLVRRVDLGMWQSVRFEDVLPDLFGLEDTKGWIEVFTTDPAFVVTARVANIGGEGAFGQTVPLVGESKMLRLEEIRFWDSYRRLVNLVMFDKNNRVNVGLVNLGPGEPMVRIRAIGADGVFIGEHSVEMAPFGHLQLDRLESVMPEVAGVGLVSLAVGMDDDGGDGVYRQGIAFYASRVDNTTGDAVFILP